MKRWQRRGSFLVEMLLILPFIAAAVTIAFQLAGQSLLLEAHESGLLADEAMMRDLLRRVQEDAGRSTGAEVSRDGGGVELALAGADGAVTYEVRGREVRRRVGGEGQAASVYPWSFTRALVDFQVERIDASPRVVWITFDTVSPANSGPDPQRRLAAAARLATGGGS